MDDVEDEMTILLFSRLSGVHFEHGERGEVAQSALVGPTKTPVVEGLSEARRERYVM